MSARSDIASAVNAVEGITCSEYFSQSTNSGSAYVRLDRIEYPNQFGGVAFWDIVVLLPGDYAQAEKYFEIKVPLIRDALNPHLVIDRVQPQQISLNGVGVIPAAFISGHREE